MRLSTIYFTNVSENALRTGTFVRFVRPPGL